MKSGYWYIVAATLLYSSMEIALKMVADQYNPMQMNFLRFLIGMCILLPIAIRHLKKLNIKLDKEDWKTFCLTGFIAIILSTTFYQLAILYCKASVVAVLYCCNPVFAVPLAWLILKEKIDRVTFVSLIVSIIGVLVILNPFNLGRSDSNFWGIIFAILATVLFALYLVVGKSRSKKYGGIVLSAFSFVTGVGFLLILILVSHINPIAGALNAAGLGMFADIPVFAGITWQGLPMLLYIGVALTGVAYTMVTLAMEKTSAASVSVIFFIKPALAPILALLILGEVITPNVIGGIVFIIAGAVITFVSSKMKAKAALEKEAERAIT